MKRLIVLCVLLVPSLSFAQLVPGGFGGQSVEIRQGMVFQGNARIINCEAGMTCTVSGTIAEVSSSGGGGGAPTGVPYWTGAADATLTAEHNLGALGTGLVLNTAGTPSILAGNTCAANNFGLSISASGVLGCAQPLFSNLSGSATDAQIPNNITIDLAALATALAANGGNCAGNNFALGVDQAGVAECAQPAFSNLSGTATTAQIGDDQITYAKIQNISATSRLLGRITAGAGDTEELTGTQATTLLDPFTTALKGLAPASGGGTTNFLRADGTWAAPAGGGGAPTDATYWVGAAHAGLSAEINLGALGTGLVINTTGTPSIYGGTSCTNQFPRSLNASGAATCQDVVPADFASQTANFVLAAPDGAAGDPTFRALVDADIPNTISLTNLTQIGTRQISDTTGTLLIPRGGTGLTTVATNQVLVGTAADTFTAKTIPSCSNGTTEKLLYNNSTQTFSCGTDAGGGGGLTHGEVMSRVALGF